MAHRFDGRRDRPVFMYCFCLALPVAARGGAAAAAGDHPRDGADDGDEDRKAYGDPWSDAETVIAPAVVSELRAVEQPPMPLHGCRAGVCHCAQKKLNRITQR